MLRRMTACLMLGSLALAGCSGTVAAPGVVREQTVHVSGDDPMVDLGGGHRIAVDGVPPGETVPLQMTHFLTPEGRVAVDFDSAAEE